MPVFCAAWATVPASTRASRSCCAAEVVAEVEARSASPRERCSVAKARTGFIITFSV